MQKMQHMTGKELAVLKYFYTNQRGHVRRIQRATKLSEHTLLKGLAVLERKKMLKLRKEGNLKIYEADQKKPAVMIFFSYFDLERQEALEYNRGKAASLFIEGVKTAKRPSFALMFGSTAKGNYTAKSDIDIVVVYDSFDKNILKKTDEIKKGVFAETGLRINVILMGLDEFLKERKNSQNYALQDALATGYPVFGHQLYYEVTTE